VKLAERLLERLPDGRLELIDDSYTFIPIDQPERLAELVREFVLEDSREEVAR
jgi:pimeloyl-ACP methyl ester carboxylesterase